LVLVLPARKMTRAKRFVKEANRQSLQADYLPQAFWVNESAKSAILLMRRFTESAYSNIRFPLFFVVGRLCESASAVVFARNPTADSQNRPIDFSYRSSLSRRSISPA
jgi:hypothetical protein